jgi:hypothetical protein
MVVGPATLRYGPDAMGGKGDRPSLENRWWVDQQKVDSDGLARPEAKYGARFFRSGEGYDQDTAQRRLTDLNLKWFDEAPCEPGAWSVVHTLSKQRVPEPRLERIRSALSLPPDALGVLVDSGEAVRAIATTRPIGARLVEIRFGRDSSFDAWVRGEWVHEVAFRTVEQALRQGPRLLTEYLTTARAEPIY